MIGKKVGLGTLEYIRDVECSTDCSKTIPINKGLSLPCKSYTPFESDLLRRRALKDEQLFASGFTRYVDRSAIGDDLMIKNTGINIGEIRTEASGARGIRDCNYNFESFGIEEFEKRFYVVNTNKHLKLCPRDLIGSSLQDLIGGTMEEYDNFGETDLADILIGLIIETYNKDFVAKFILLAVYENEGANMHGDDGVFAKAYYAWKGQYFHTIQYDYVNLVAGKALNAIVGGRQYSKTVTETGGDVNLLLLDFVNWVNGLKEGKDFLYNTSVDLAGKKVVVVSRFAAVMIRLRTAVGEEGAVQEWSSATCSNEDTVITTVLQSKMMVNDTPLMFPYVEINESNFISLFKSYIKQFLKHLKRNGFQDLGIDDIRIGIDPELMLEYGDAMSGKFLAGGIPINFMDQIGLAASRFYPWNALNGTGYFMMAAIPEAILILGDGSNMGGGLPGTGNVKITELCDNGNFGIVFDNPIGSSVENFGVTAFNLCGSPLAVDNDLDNRVPYENTRKMLVCYSDACLSNKITTSCNISVSTSSTTEYDQGQDETYITVEVDVSNPDNIAHLIYNLGFSLSDGTSLSGIDTGTFTITLQGDQTQSGLVLNVFGTVAATDTIVPGEIATTYCTCPVTYSVQLGESPGVQYCDHTVEIELAVTTSDTGIEYTLNGVPTTYNLANQLLDYAVPADWSAIEIELEAVFPGCDVTIMDSLANPGAFTTVLIESVLAEVTALTILTDAGNVSSVMTNSCD